MYQLVQYYNNKCQKYHLTPPNFLHEAKQLQGHTIPLKFKGLCFAF